MVQTRLGRYWSKKKDQMVSKNVEENLQVDQKENIQNACLLQKQTDDKVAKAGAVARKRTKVKVTLVVNQQMLQHLQKEKDEYGRSSLMSKGTMPARNKKNFRPTKSGAGMTRAGVKAYRRLNPGSKLKTAVTGKVKPGSKAAKRRKSYCARSLGQLKRASAKTRNDPNSRIRQARRRWKC